MAHCININHPEYKKLVPQFKGPEALLKAKISIWQENNGLDNFPTIDQLEERKNILYDKMSIEEKIQGKQFQKLTAEEKAKTIEQSNILLGVNIQNQEQLEFHINTLNVVSQFLENIGIEQRLVSEFLSQDGSVVEGALAAANFIEGTVDIIDDLDKGRAEAWNKLPEEAAHWWYRLLNENSSLKKALWDSHQTALKADDLYKTQYGKLVSKPEDLTEEAIGQLIAEAIKRIETKNANTSDYSFFKKFLEWINSIIDIFKTTTQDPFEVAAMKILSSDMSDLMTWEEYRKLNNIVNFADVLTEQSVAPIDYTLIEDLGKVEKINEVVGFTNDGKRINQEKFLWVGKDQQVNGGLQFGKTSPSFLTMEELARWVSANIKQYDTRQKQRIQEVRDNQVFFDRLLNKTFRKKSKFLPKTLRKYFDIIDAQNLNPLRGWNISQELQQITKKLTPEEKRQIVETNGYTNIAPTLKVLPDLLQKYRKNPIVLSESIKIDGAKKQELSILNGIKEMIKLENPNLKSITVEEFVAEAHNWLETNYLLGFANENSYLSYRTDQTFQYLSDRQSNEDVDITNMTEEELRRLPLEERQRIANIIGLTKQNPDVYHNKVSLRFNDSYHTDYGQDANHFAKRPSAWGNLTYFYTGKNKWKDAVLLHEIQNDNIEALRNFKTEKVDLETSLGRYLQQLNADVLNNITQIESNGKKISRKIVDNNAFPTHRELTALLYYNKDLPLEQGLQHLRQTLEELIELYKSDNSVRNSIDKAQEAVDKAYTQRIIFRDFQKRGGIKSLLTKEKLEDLKNILLQLNTEEIETSTWSDYENAYFPDLSVRNLKQKKQDFKVKTIELQAKITREFQKMYGDNAPLINLFAPAKARTKNQIRRGVQRSQELNENVNWLLAYSEKKILDSLSKNIENSKRNYIRARNATTAYNFNVQLSKITLEQWANLVENYKYNEDLLNRLIDEQAQKDISKETKENNITSDKEERIFNQKSNFETLKQQALDKKAELEKNYGKIEEEVKQTLEIEMNYFTPLVHHLIQKHINQYGKDFPMYFSGYQITKRTQGNDRTALIYAGKDEINIVDKQDFEFNGKRYRRDIGGFDYLVQQHGAQSGITQQEYEKAYQQATERRAKEIKFEAAKQIGFLSNEHNGTNLSDLTDKELDEGIKELNQYKRQSRQNMDRVINTIMNISNSEPIETGAIYNAMSQISGIKLIWQDKIEGLKGDVGGYLVDLTNYNYNTPILYGLNTSKVGSKQDIEGFRDYVNTPESKNTILLQKNNTNAKFDNEIKKIYDKLEMYSYDEYIPAIKYSNAVHLIQQYNRDNNNSNYELAMKRYYNRTSKIVVQPKSLIESKENNLLTKDEGNIRMTINDLFKKVDKDVQHEMEIALKIRTIEIKKVSEVPKEYSIMKVADLHHKELTKQYGALEGTIKYFEEITALNKRFYIKEFLNKEELIPFEKKLDDYNANNPGNSHFYQKVNLPTNDKRDKYIFKINFTKVENIADQQNTIISNIEEDNSISLDNKQEEKTDEEIKQELLAKKDFEKKAENIKENIIQYGNVQGKEFSQQKIIFPEDINLTDTQKSMLMNFDAHFPNHSFLTLVEKMLFVEALGDGDIIMYCKI